MPPRGRRRSRAKGGYEEPTSRNEGSSSSDGVTDSTKVGMFCFCVAAIYGAYITQGVLLELGSVLRVLRLVFPQYPKVNAWHLMMGMNLWGTAYMALFMFLIPGGGGYDAVGFCLKHPEAAWDIFLFCLCGALGQNFIFLTISRFGALTNTTITTTRKFVSILVSSIWNGNPLSPQQWAGVAMVFCGLSYQTWCKYQKKLAKGADGAGSALASPKSPRSPTSSARSRSRGSNKRRKH